jgi:aspartate kinase
VPAAPALRTGPSDKAIGGEEVAMSEARRPVILKFGGTSVDGASRLRRVAEIVRKATLRSPVAVVVSAMAGVTDALAQLLAATQAAGDRWRALLAALEGRHLDAIAGIDAGGERAEHLCELRGHLGELRHAIAGLAGGQRLDPPMRDRVLAAGERCCVPLAVAALRAAGLPAVAVDAADLIATDSTFGGADVDRAVTGERTRSRLAGLPAGAIPVIPGFVGADGEGRTTVLGRGGSDWSAGLLGAALGAARVEIWTDVPGVLSGPPRWVPEATTVPRLSAPEAAALALWGGKVLHPRTLEPLARDGMPLLVASSFSPDGPATLIAGRRPTQRIVAVSGRPGVTLPPAAGRAAMPAIDPDDGRSVASALDESTAGELAMVAVVGGGGAWTGPLRAAIRAARLPVLAVVPRLNGAAVGLVVRTYHLRRTVKVLHDVLIAAPGVIRRCLRAAPAMSEATP